jgi:hypothetical protein
MQQFQSRGLRKSRVYPCFHIPLLASSFYIALLSAVGARRPIAEVSGTRVDGQDQETNSHGLVAQTRLPAA